MIIREGHTEEYQKKLRLRHILEGILLGVASAMLVLSAAALMQRQRSLLQVIILLGGILNAGLAVRSAVVRFWLGTVAALVLALLCLGGLLLLKYY